MLSCQVGPFRPDISEDSKVPLSTTLLTSMTEGRHIHSTGEEFSSGAPTRCI